MGRRQIAQAVEFVRALHVQLQELNDKLASIERQIGTASNARARALRIEATTLRRDIREAQSLVEQLERCYLGGNSVDPARPAARQRQARLAASR
ncbi:hypothetical protein MYSE111917_11405 [Mycobacterium senriense]|uniref:Uncharacterized protein n=1 Tax=Mycobacterium senriense TaxID=2775496 RepID=A0ABM7SQ31_9MYCO|nr:hypothetical protein [Mycobacterium senriense]BCZ22279.1 hypothetical protein MTY59_21340 [Mycobacterium senriense]